MHEYLKIVAEGGTLSKTEAEGAMRMLMSGEAPPEQAAGLLVGLRTRGETLEELVGFTKVMREFAVPVNCQDPHAIDLCGTGGDSTGSFNISTAAGFVAAGAGVTVAKHGNRSVSSRCGSADVLEALGVRVDLRKEGVEFCLKEAGISFIFAPFFHPAMRHVMGVRRALGIRTFFNILGPITNPAGVRRQLVGAFSPEVARRMAGILRELGAARVYAVHSADGMDELTLSGPNKAFVSDDGSPVEEETIEPTQFGFEPATRDDLLGGDALLNAEIVRGILGGKTGPATDVVLLNATYAIHVSGKYPDLQTAHQAAMESLRTGAGLRALNRLIEVSQAAPYEGVAA